MEEIYLNSKTERRCSQNQNFWEHTEKLKKICWDGLEQCSLAKFQYTAFTALPQYIVKLPLSSGSEKLISFIFI